MKKLNKAHCDNCDELIQPYQDLQNLPDWKKVIFTYRYSERSRKNNGKSIRMHKDIRDLQKD